MRAKSMRFYHAMRAEIDVLSPARKGGLRRGVDEPAQVIRLFQVAVVE